MAMVGVAVAVLAITISVSGASGLWSPLADIAASEPGAADFFPAFEPRISRLEAKLTEETATHFTLALTFGGSVCGARHPCQILVDDKPLAQGQMDVNVALGESLHRVEKTVRIKVAEVDGTGWGGAMRFLHVNADLRSREYEIEVVRPPQYDNMVTPTDIVVKDALGRVIRTDPPYSPERARKGSLKYVAEGDRQAATLQVSCPAVAGVTQKYDQLLAAVGAVQPVNYMRGDITRIQATCSYSDWDKTISKTFVLVFGQHEQHRDEAGRDEATISARLMALPQYGFCESVEADDEELRPAPGRDLSEIGGSTAKTGTVCKLDESQGMFVATFSSTSEGAQPTAWLVDRQTGQRFDMFNGVPKGIALTYERRYFAMEVKDGDVSLSYPVVFIWVALCDTLACPSGQAPVSMNAAFDAKQHMCANETCNELDQEHCCVDRAMCSSYHAVCPAGHVLRSDAADVACEGAACSLENDVFTCCQPTWSSTTTRTRTGTTSTRTGTTSTMTTTTRTNTGTTSTRTGTTSTRSTTTQTTTTRTGTTTTSTTAYCTESNVFYTPLDMKHTKPTIEASGQACQDRCKAKEGCVHFSFWTDIGHCHLQDDSATRIELGFGFEAGPRDCLPGATVTTTNTITVNEECRQTGLFWSPLMTNVPQYLHGSEEEMVRQCQKLCARTTGCARFVLDINQKMCRFADSSATPSVGALRTVSGPPTCGAVYEEMADLMVRRFEEPPLSREAKGEEQEWSAGSLRTFAAFAVLSAASSLALVSCHRRSRWGASGAVLLLADPAAAE